MHANMFIDLLSILPSVANLDYLLTFVSILKNKQVQTLAERAMTTRLTVSTTQQSTLLRSCHNVLQPKLKTLHKYRQPNSVLQ